MIKTDQRAPCIPGVETLRNLAKRTAGCPAITARAASQLGAHPGDDLQLDLVPRLLQQTDGLRVTHPLQRVAVHRQQTVPAAQLTCRARAVSDGQPGGGKRN